MNQRYKLISKDDGGTFELYDLLSDPEESDDIAGSREEIVARLKAELAEWQSAVDRDGGTRLPGR